MPVIVWQNSRFGGASYGAIEYGAGYIGNLLSKSVPGDPPTAPPNTINTYVGITGTLDGVNTLFNTALMPVSTLQLYRNGGMQTQGAGSDYTLSGNLITFQASSIPQPGDILVGIAILATQYTTMSGAINGVNAVFTLAVPATFLLLFHNGILQNPGLVATAGGAGDYTLGSNKTTITFNAGSIPQTGDILTAKIQIT